MHTAIWLTVFILIAATAGGVIYTWNLSGKIFRFLLMRETRDKWDRTCSFPDDVEYSGMYRQALSWRDEHASYRKDVSVTSDALKLCGEYYDLGYKRAVIIIPGRTESCYYSCFFAPPYKEAGFNILTIDNRAHGHSEGTYPTLGFSEYRDLLAWGRMLHDDFGIETVMLHGICIGASAALFALTDSTCPDYMSAMVADGMYTTFFDSFVCHMHEDHHPVFPVAYEIMMRIWMKTGARPISDGPVKRIGLMTRPILFLHSREDTFSLPEKAESLYNKCISPVKKMHFFDRGAHSRIRYNSREEYDCTVVDFIKQLYA